MTVTYQDAGGLERTIRSVQSQTHRSIQHVVVDGGSTDSTGQLLADYAPEYALQVVSEPDHGIFDAINKGLRLATGDLVVCMNAGDTFTSDTDLAFVGDDWIRYRWSWGYGCQRYIDERGTAFSGDIQAPFNRRKLELGLSFVPHQAMYVERRFQASLGQYDAALGIAADQDMAIRAAQRTQPRVWIRFLTDFLVGGAHADVSRGRREWLYHRIRVRHGRTVLRSRLADVATTGGITAVRSSRDLIARAFNPGGRRRL